MSDPPLEEVPDPERVPTGRARSADGRGRSWFDWWLRNRSTGRITVAQWPNVALWIVLATVVARRVVSTDGPVGATLDWIGLAALAWWALDEVFRGVNPWRRLLGAGGCGLVIAALVSMLH